jgi:hypothetical protein
MTTKTFKYFTDFSSIDMVKKQYKKLAFKLHPDVGGSTEEMQQLNNEYEAALKQIEYIDKTTGETKTRSYQFDKEYIDLIEKLIKLNMENVDIEICGFFIWLTGNTKEYKDDLKTFGLWYSRDKQAWYYKPAWYKGHNTKAYSMDTIRNTYGSINVNGFNNSNNNRNSNNNSNKSSDYITE